MTFINPQLTLENDLEMLQNGFEFEVGELDWYLESDMVSDKLKDQLREAKKEYNV